MTASASALLDVTLHQGVVREHDPASNRFIVWYQTSADDTFEYWERLATAANAGISAEPDFEGVVPASVIPVRRTRRNRLPHVLQMLLGQTKARSFRLPDGRFVQQCGERKSVLLVLSRRADDDQAGEKSIKSRWPKATRVQSLGPLLHLVENVEPKPAAARPPSEASSETTGHPREQAERELAMARAAGDRAREATALTDLGVICLNEGKLDKASSSLELAFQIVQQLNDSVAEYEILGHLGMIALSHRQSARAKELFDRCLAHAQKTGDPFAAKMALERLGITFSSVGDAPRAIEAFEQALTLARQKGDLQQQSNLLWFQAVQFAEMGKREFAIAKGDEAIAIARTLGKPQASVLGSYLQKYRMGLENDVLAGGPDQRRQGVGPEAFLGGSVMTSVMSQDADRGKVNSQPPPPSLLRQALSATKAMANYVGSGFKSTPPDLQRKRLETCAGCEHHTGMRCRVCGCFTEIKSRMLHEACPIGKWPG